MLLIELEGITKSYGPVRALEDVHLVLEQGTVGLLGPNGAGKTTLLRVLLGILPPDSGRGRVLGLDIRHRSLKIRSLVGYLPENDAFVPGLDSVAFVAMAGELCGMPRRDAIRRAHEVLTYLGLEEARYRKLEQYSAGMKQRLKLAQALVHDPDILFLDEPTTGLDPAGREDMLRLIQTLARDFGKSVILSSHILEDVDRVCECMVVIREGRILSSGRIDDLRAHYAHRYRIRVDAGSDGYFERLEEMGGEIVERTANGEVVVTVPEGFPTRRFFEIARDRGAVLRGLRPDRERLDQLFRRISQEAPHGD